MKKISAERFTQLIGIGFIASFATVIDDIIAYSPLFLEDNMAYVTIGIIIATLAEIYIVIRASDMIARVKYKEEIASAGLVVLGILILAGIV